MRTIIALDYSNKEDVLEFLSNFDEAVFVKVGMELVYSSGTEIIKELKKLGHKIFLDLKLHDIPNTVKEAIKNLAKLDIDMINVHASGGVKMMKYAMDGVKEVEAITGKRPLVIAVTQLTSTSKEVMNNELCILGDVSDVCLTYAKNAKEAGLDGVVCSVFEVETIHKNLGKDFITVTPGIRLDNDDAHDQVRVATPKLANDLGSNYIVVGRSITKSENPRETYNLIEGIMGE